MREEYCPNIRFGTFEQDIYGKQVSLGDFTVIVIVPSTVEEKVIYGYAEKLLTDGCRDFAFCGDTNGIWHRTFDDADIHLNGNSDEVATTWDISDISEIPDELCVCKENVLIICENADTIRKCHKEITEQGYGFKVRYIGKDMVAIERGKEYYVLSVERGWYRILTELDEDYLFPPEAFELIE